MGGGLEEGRGVHWRACCCVSCSTLLARLHVRDLGPAAVAGVHERDERVVDGRARLEEGPGGQGKNDGEGSTSDRVCTLLV